MPDQLVAGVASRGALESAGDRELVIDAVGGTRTGRELGARAAQLAGALAARNLSGQRVGLWQRNGFAAVEALLAVEWIGATRVAVDPDVPPTEAMAIFDAAGVEVVIADEAHASALGGDVLIHDDDTRHTGVPWTEVATIDPSTPYLLTPRSVAGGELFAATMSYQNWDAAMRINCDLYRTGWYGQPWGGDDERLLTMQQVAHGTTVLAGFPFLLMGLPQVVMTKFDASVALELIHRHHITATFCVPGMLTRIADALGPDSADLPLRHTVYGGAPLPVEELRRVRRILGGSLVQMYGRWEAGFPLAVLGQDEHQAILEGDDQLATSCGRPIPHVDVPLVDGSGSSQDHGELQTRNAMIYSDYLDSDGWYAVGDSAYFDDNGYLHLTGRSDGMINSGSYHVYPQQVVEAVCGVEGVADARVVGEPDPVWGQRIVAYVRAKNPDNWDDLVNRLQAELPTRIARYKVPRVFHQVK